MTMMEKKEIKKIQRMAQNLLEQLQDTDATFLFIGDEGNCFTIAGKWWLRAGVRSPQEARIYGSWYRELHIGSTWTGTESSIQLYDHRY